MTSLAPDYTSTPQTLPMSDTGEGATRRPRIAIMGEFSAGKSTLTNLLMGEPALPTRVTATQLPPVWISFGCASAYGESTSGERFDVELDKLDGIDVAATRYLRVFHGAPLLEQCDVIDFPGISDPNMDADVWQRVVPLADAVLWCTHATQAWRQSEAAVWEDMPPELYDTSFLLLTRMDRLGDPRDRRRVVARVTRETDGFFDAIFPVSLTRAMAAETDSGAWEDSGVKDLVEALTGLISDLTLGLERGTLRATDGTGQAPERDGVRARSRSKLRAVAPVASGPPDASGTSAVKSVPRVKPRRVRPLTVVADRPPAEQGPMAPP